jgi:acyl-CoA thioester hydrolase
VLANSNVDYRRPILWPNDLILELLVERIGRTLLYADGNVVMVWIDTDTCASVPLPECGARRLLCRLISTAARIRGRSCGR